MDTGCVGCSEIGRRECSIFSRLTSGTAANTLSRVILLGTSAHSFPSVVNTLHHFDDFKSPRRCFNTMFASEGAVELKKSSFESLHCFKVTWLQEKLQLHEFQRRKKVKRTHNGEGFT
ncbi:hypothetical protein J6590_061549 [Homalodisca vitripennis]|nr:hypothetical protein J6590_061549 [Homalodisca vitripennis]